MEPPETEHSVSFGIARTPPLEDGSVTKCPTLSLYITSLMVDFAHSDFEMNASLMTSIKSLNDRAGERGARAEWVSEHWSDWTFRRESEVWGEWLNYTESMFFFLMVIE
jgi:hypothetical protein